MSSNWPTNPQQSLPEQESPPIPPGGYSPPNTGTPPPAYGSPQPGTPPPDFGSQQQGGPPAGGSGRWQETSRRRSRSGAWIGGVILIAIGIIFILQNTGSFYLGNWWALFILIPAFAAFANVWRSMRENNGRFTPAASGSLIGGLILLLITVIFLFNLDWGVMWPFILIIAGVGALLTAVLRR